MKILLTGRDGQLGQALIPKLAPLGEVTATSRVQLDLADVESIDGFVRRLSPDLIVNAAAYTAVDAAESEPDLAMTVNGSAVGALAAAGSACGAAMMHFSTDYVFDGSGDEPYRETDPTAPINAYGRSKLAGETAVTEASVPHVIIRTSWLYAAAGRNFLTTMLRLGAERVSMSVVDDQHGAPTSADALAKAVTALLAQADGDPGGLFARKGGLLHVACVGSTTWHGFATAIFAEARRLGLALTVKEVKAIPSHAYPTPAERPRNSRLATDRAANVFGLALPDWRTALKSEMETLARYSSASKAGQASAG